MPIFSTIFDLIYPEKCLSCKRPGKPICSECLFCFPSSREIKQKWIFSVYDYRDPRVKKSIWLLKYNNKRKIAEILAEALHEKIMEELSELSILENFRNPIIIPIPLASKRKRERGFNQAEILCRKIIKQDIENNFSLVTDVLRKPKDTPHQAKIEDRKKRLENIRGSFVAVNTEKIKNRNIILIDDVTTTGATLEEARKILKNSGAKKIIAFTVAH